MVCVSGYNQGMKNETNEKASEAAVHHDSLPLFSASHGPTARRSVVITLATRQEEADDDLLLYKHARAMEHACHTAIRCIEELIADCEVQSPAISQSQPMLQLQYTALAACRASLYPGSRLRLNG